MKDFNELITEILEGKTSLQDPIDFNISDRKSERLPIEEYFHQYKNINNDNYLNTLYTILNLFRRKFHSLYNENEDLKNFINNHLKIDWNYKKDFLSLFDIGIQDGFFENIEECNNDYHKSLELHDNFIKFDNHQKKIPIDSFLRNESPMERKISGILSLFDDIYRNIKIFSNDLEDYIRHFKKLELSILIDFSYNCNNIPQNINKIFLNYIILLNIFHKEIIKLDNHINGLLKKIENNSNHLKSLNNNKDIATFNISDIFGNTNDDNTNDDNYVNNTEDPYVNIDNDKILSIINKINGDDDDLQYMFNDLSRDIKDLKGTQHQHQHQFYE